MLIKRPSDIPASDITDERIYRQRRRFITGAGLLGLGLAGGLLLPGLGGMEREASARQGRSFASLTKSPFSSDEALTDYDDVTGYCNFYEFGAGKTDPARHAHTLHTEPWSVVIDGEVDKPGKIALEDILKGRTLEERIYRLRCVEAWSMVIPWVGFPLADLLKSVNPNSRAKYVAFETLHDPEQMPAQKTSLLPWPYVEGLTIAEAMNPLTLLAVGLYGHELPNQNGAPLRLVVPWKYGFKSIKSIVRITLSEKQPPTTWSRLNPREYGFYANVNPAVDHPRWSQARERRIGEWRKRETLPFNGYAEQVAHLYAGMDPKKLY